MISTSFFKSQLEEAMEKTTMTVEEILRRAGVSKSTFYASVMDAKTERTNISVAVRIAKAMGLGYRREGERFYFTPLESEENLDKRTKKIIEKLKTLKPETREKLEFLIEQLADKDKL